jgi:DamX protein
MPADNDLTYSYQKPSPNKLTERALITLERTQKLDLLVHLLTNLQQSLVICGPTGIGKTTLLKALQDTRTDRWHFCQLSGASSLSFESILQQLSRSLNLPGSGIQLDINSLRASCAQQKVILIIDDAGDLVPGLIGELAAFADSLTGLRLVFAMSYDEFHIKSNIDTVLEEFHVIELPPLTRKQCWEYLQNLSVHPDMPLSFNGINDTLVDDLYRETHGVPGRILAELPKLNQYHSRHLKKWTLGLGVIAATAVAGYVVYSWLIQSPLTLPVSVSAPPSITSTSTPTLIPSITNLPSPPPLSSTALPIAVVPTSIPIDTITPTPVVTVLTTSVKPTAATSVTASPANTPEPSRPTTASLGSLSAAAVATVSPTPLPPAPMIITATVQPSPVVTPTPAPITKAINPTEADIAAEKKPTTENSSLADKPSSTPTTDQEWIMAQPANNFTLQVMTLSSNDSVRRFKKKYAEYGESLKYYTVYKGEQEKFILIYGSFESIAEAKRYKEIMPGEFKQALEKRFRFVQKESHR